VTAASGASPAVLAHLPPAVHLGYVTGFARSLQTVFLVAVPFGVLAFALSWTIKDVPLRTTTGVPDPADTLAPTSRPTMRTSDQEMERALTSLISRENRREIYQNILSEAGVEIAPRAAWMMLRVGEHPGCGRQELAGHLHLTGANLDRRLGELVASGYLQALPADPGKPLTFTEMGQQAYENLYRVAHDHIERLAADWQPEQHPRLRALVTQLIHQLAASDERPDRDLDTVGDRPN
jgi:DNA-binding MarR family transcriptional regulator